MKRFAWLLLFALLLIPVPGHSQTSVSVSDFVAGAYESITVSTTAIGVTDSNIKTGGVFITCETSNIRFRFDGTAPTATEGHLLYVGQSLIIRNATATRKLKFIRDTGATADATIRVSHLQ